MNMSTENECNIEAEIDADVKTLQNCLFPPQLTTSNSYFSNFFIKSTTEFNEDEDELRIKIKDSFIASREIFPTARDTAFILQPPRWPTECQVLEDRIKHISYVPPAAEPYYLVTGNECQPKPSGEECGIIVYQYTPISAVNYFSRSSVGGSRYLLSSNLYPDDDSLRFESRFESGNLARAIRITPSYYELHLRADLYTNRHMQWFYFRVTNMKKNFLYRFSITNCSKEGSLYNEGMRPLMYSTKDSQLHSIGWRRCGQNISYFSNDNINSEDPDQPQTYTLTFTVTFPHDDDEVYLAHCYPYTYSDLQEHLAEIRAHPVKQVYSTVRLLCRTLAGNDVYFVTITSPQVPGELKKKRAVVITARVHPGETPSSWIMKGILDFLTGDSAPAKDLRDKFIFKIVPMLNPDGVIVGNNRCSLSARDLNRQYRTVMRDAYPSIWYTKLMVRRLLEECGVALYCDLHAHSRKHNIFIYGCENRRGGDRRLQEQVFPLMLHKNTADKFSFESCKFRIQKAKEGTGRVVMWMMGIANSYTMEASFAGSTLGARIDTHFTTQDYEQMGKSFCQTLLDFYDEDPRKEKLRTKIVERLTKEGSNADEPTNIPLSDYSSDDGDTSSSSDEVGREEKEEDEPSLPQPPPPSPAVTLKRQGRPAKSSPLPRPKAVASRSPCALRKPLPVNRKYDLEIREYTQYEIDHPERDKDDFTEQRVIWCKPQKAQSLMKWPSTSHFQGPVSLHQIKSSPDDFFLYLDFSPRFKTKTIYMSISWRETQIKKKYEHATIIQTLFPDDATMDSEMCVENCAIWCLEICKATLKLSLSDKEYIESSSETEEEEEKITKTKIKVFRKKRKKKKTVRKRMELREHSDSEITYKKSVTSLSVFDLIANEKIPCPLLTQRSRTPQPRALTEKKNEITKQLAEVQAKLYTLKNKLWFGIEQGDAPLATSRSSFYFSSTKSVSTQKITRKISKKTTKKSDKSSKKEAKPSLEKLERSGTKIQNGLKRQSAVSWLPSEKLTLRKSKSLPDTSSTLNDKLKEMNIDEEKMVRLEKSKKKKRKGKFSKKAKALSNAKIFVTQPKD